MVVTFILLRESALEATRICKFHSKAADGARSVSIINKCQDPFYSSRFPLLTYD